MLRLTEIPQIDLAAGFYRGYAGVHVHVVGALKARAGAGLAEPREVDRQANARLGRRDDLRPILRPRDCTGVALREHGGRATRQHVLVGVNAVLPVCGSRVGVGVHQPRQQQVLREVESFLCRAGNVRAGGDDPVAADGYCARPV